MKLLSSLLPVSLALCCLRLFHRTVSAQDFFTSPLGKLIQASGTLGERIGLVTTEKNDKIIREGEVNKTPPNRKGSNNKDEDYKEEYENLDFDDDDEPINFDAFAAQNGNSVIHFQRKGGEVMVPCFGMWWPMGGGASGGGGGGYDYYGGDYYDGDYRRKRRRSKKRRKAKMKRKKKA